MELTGKLTWLILSTCAILGQAQCEGGNEVANIHTLIAGMQVLRTVAVSIIYTYLSTKVHVIETRYTSHPFLLYTGIANRTLSGYSR